jgi:hypothetical protein
MRNLKSRDHGPRTTDSSESKGNDHQIAEVLNLIKDADSIELKMIVPDTDRASAITALDMDVLQAELRQVVFFDTPDLKLNRSGLVLRARRMRKGGDSVVKLRPIIPAEIPSKLRRSSSFIVEVDALPGKFVCSGSLKGRADNNEVLQVMLGHRSIRKLFLPEQRALYKQHAPKGVDMDSLISFGPINIAKLKLSPAALKGLPLVSELWFYPDGSRILELSTKCSREAVFQVVAEVRAFLVRRGITITGNQQTKTQKAMDYFSRLHSAKAA